MPGIDAQINKLFGTSEPSKPVDSEIREVMGKIAAKADAVRKENPELFGDKWLDTAKIALDNIVASEDVNSDAKMVMMMSLMALEETLKVLTREQRETVILNILNGLVEHGAEDMLTPDIEQLREMLNKRKG